MIRSCLRFGALCDKRHGANRALLKITIHQLNKTLTCSNVKGGVYKNGYLSAILLGINGTQQEEKDGFDSMCDKDVALAHPTLARRKIK